MLPALDNDEEAAEVAVEAAAAFGERHGLNALLLMPLTFAMPFIRGAITTGAGAVLAVTAGAAVAAEDEEASTPNCCANDELPAEASAEADDDRASADSLALALALAADG